MSDHDTILAGVILTLSSCMEIPIDEITPESDLVGDLGLDSLDVLELVMALEDDHTCEIPDDAIQDADITVRDLAAIVERYTTRIGAP